ncbi:hypothetical protein GUJ93_ZPchr0013g34018 [Zizania palustris]|uniref:Uncharacterized protein n=1 Tax=Zizania palustris TaxID=103762 RepID=A0A8J5X2E6_ZIZPA|nr:hypothetical protein GUJ93_ZPchr0013g34018 [Zizania palustris]
MTSTSSSSAGRMNGKRRHDVLVVISGGSRRWGSERWELWAMAGHLQADKNVPRTMFLMEILKYNDNECKKNLPEEI